jgi:hypothetical protein
MFNTVAGAWGYGEQAHNAYTHFFGQFVYDLLVCGLIDCAAGQNTCRKN